MTDAFGHVTVAIRSHTSVTAALPEAFPFIIGRGIVLADSDGREVNPV